ncbi:hypothetical protein RJ639_027468 [Escallonia herrerae]|uniref:SANT domain-containing protein n=1 Tax=Escallonia herrerae TaxID=1293975 RepID=A0AA89BFE6_9ASTE|nr:hypothetical protein RJ639_027468 [Escallonia herrerae]
MTEFQRKLRLKRKLSDMLGPQWSKEELGRFYDAYRKHGKDWKKVAAVVRNRSVQMVEALYSMNRAYLSLPEGTASVVGLIAMMTDHYSNLAGSDSEQESNDAGPSRKLQKRAPSKLQHNTSKESDVRSISQSEAVASSYGCLPLLKKRRSGGNRPRAVGKRTPRYPVSFSYENVNGEKYFSPTRQGLRLKPKQNDDEVAHEIAVALAEASHRGGSPQASQTPKRRAEFVMPAHARNAERMHAGFEMNGAKLIDADIYEDGLEGSMEADNGIFARDKSSLMERRSFGTLVQKGRRLPGKQFEVDDNGNNHIDDIREACSGTEGGQKVGQVKGKFDIETTDAKISRSSSQASRKRTKKVLFTRDEDCALDALQTLADLSLMMPDEDEPSVPVKEDKDDPCDEPGLLESVPSNRREKRKLPGFKQKGNQLLSRSENAATKTSKLVKPLVPDDGTICETKEESYQSTTRVSRRKQKMSASRISKDEAHSDTHLSESQEAEARDAEKKSASKGKRSSQSSSNIVKLPEASSSSTDPRKEESDSTLSTIQVPRESQVNLPTKVRNRRKANLEKPQILKDLKAPEKIARDQLKVPFPSLHGKAFDLKEKLSDCLSNHRVRRWCAFEWFYSAIDYPWFAKREFVEYLYHVGLGHVPRLTRVEWGVIRSSLGKPRRFSKQFLKEEKEKLNQYRDSVRTHYTELRAGTREGLPTDLARPLTVGQRVIAIHPRTREIHDGSVLTVDHNRCRVQFDRPDLGVEFVMIICLPVVSHTM